jgi:hypothetical protein
VNGQTWLICGGRDFADQAMFDDAMSQIIQMRGVPRLIIEGGASGADKMAQAWAQRMGVWFMIERPEWECHGKAAGPIRNQKMLDKYSPAVVVAFPGGTGTADMVRRAHSTDGIDVIEVQLKAAPL